VPFKISGMKPGRFRAEVEKRITALNEQARLPEDWPVPLPSGQDHVTLPIIAPPACRQ
jgi:hypothetical protein